MLENQKSRFVNTVFFLLILSAIACFVRYIVFDNFTVYTNEEMISESIFDQVYDVIENGL